MKITLLPCIIAICSLNVYANESSGQTVLDRKISLSSQKTEIREVIRQLEKETGIHFLFSPNFIGAKRKISFTATDKKLGELLTDIFSPLHIGYKVMDEQILLFETDGQHNLLLNAGAVNDRTITGTVRNEAGEPLASASIVVKGSGKGVTTDAKGNFSIKIPDGKTVLVVSAVGYQPKEITTGAADSYEISLTPVAGQLADVVVVGYGKQTRKNLTSSIATIKPEDLNRGAISDVGQMLQGKVPGLNITRSGDPNRASAVILRGASTLNQSQAPFFVIDGVPGADISAVAADDIASIDVLKDASATSIYGNRASNGVIIVTTKKGKKGQAVIGYNAYVGVEKVSNQLDMMDATQLKSFLDKNGFSFSPADDKKANTNWQESVQRKSAISHNHNLSLSGGGEHNTYSASINYFDQQGIMQESRLQRIIARLSLEQYAFKDKVKLGISVSNSNNSASFLPYRNTVLAQMITYLPVSPVKNEDGTYFENFNNTSYFNPVSIINHADEKTKYNNLIANFTTQVKLPWGLTYDLNIAYQNFSTLYGAYYDSYFTKYYNSVRSTPDPPANPTFITLTGNNGYAVRNTYQNTNKILETYFTWKRSFGNHDVNAVLGYSWQGNTIGDGFQTTSTNFTVDNTGYYNLALSNPYAVPAFRVDFGPSEVYQDTRLISNFARLNYNYDNRYLLQASIRRDGGSMFGDNYKWGYFPSVGIGWRIAQEKFMQQQKLFTDLKLRASYGETGNSAGFNPYTAQFSFNSYGTYYNNGAQVSAIGPSRAANPNLRWEKTATANIGIDFTLLDGRLSGAIDLYSKKTTDMIYSYNIDPVLVPTGSIVANVGSMSNKGVELSITAVPVAGKNFNWTTSFNLANNRNKIISLSNEEFRSDSIRISQPDGSGQTGSTLQLIKAGKPLGQFFSLQYAGKNEEGVSQYYKADGSLTTTPVIGVDYRYVGSPQPVLLMGWANTFKYKQFDLNIFFRSAVGNKIFNVTRADLFRPSTAQSGNILVEVANESPTDVNSYKYSSRFIEDGSYVRLDNATLGYTLPLRAASVKNVRLYVSTNNLFVITGYKGIDPEINQGGLAPGVDANNFYPKTRTFLLGVNVSF